MATLDPAAVPANLEDLEAVILAKMKEVCSHLGQSGKNPEALSLASGMIGELEGDFARNRVLRENSRKIRAFRTNHQKVIANLMLQRAKAFQAVAEEAEKTLGNALKKMPKPEVPPLPKARPPKVAPPAPPKLLHPQELRDQIARKIERPPAPPQTTGNIWENWGKNQQTPPSPPADGENNR
jgi:hypothetical protein